MRISGPSSVSSPVVSFSGPSIEWLVADGAEDVTDEFITAPPGSESDSELNPLAELRPTSDSREVFIVHGRNNGASDALFQFLRSIDLHPLEWNEAVRSTGKTSPYVAEILDAAFSRAHAVVVLFTPDDEATSSAGIPCAWRSSARNRTLRSGPAQCSLRGRNGHE